jgi:hypothetical protein
MTPTRLALATALLALPALAAASSWLSTNDYLRALPGNWGREGCKEYPHRIELLHGGRQLLVTDEEGSHVYDVDGAEGRGLKVRLQGEERRDSQGNVVYWHVVLENPDRFWWLRSDRKPDDLRGPVERCR